MSTVTAERLVALTGKRVNLTVDLGEVPEGQPNTDTFEGTIKVGNHQGVLFQKKGISNGSLFGVDQILEVEEIAEKPVKVSQKRVDPLEAKGARRHLALYHATPLSWLNSNTDEAALEYHATLDHSDLGHKHEVKPVKATADEATEGDVAVEDETASE
jgi:hypothetical protein